MPDVSFTIAQRPYTIRCAPGQEARVEAAAADLGERVGKLAARAGGGDDRRLLVIAALELLDSLNDAEARAAGVPSAPADLQGTQAEPTAAETAASKADAAEAAALRDWAGSVAERIDTLLLGLDPLVTPDKDA